MIRIKNFSLFRWISLALFVSAALLLVVELVSFSRLRSGFALGTEIAGVPVGGLTLDEAANRLTQAYSVPIEIRYGDAVIQAKPATLGFELNLNSMVTAADQERVSTPFWTSFVNYLFNRLPTSQTIPLVATIDETKLREYLVNEIVPRYDQPAAAYVPIPGSVNFEAGKAGSQLDVDRSVELVSMALRSPTTRVVNLSVGKINSSKPSFTNLKVLMQQIIDVASFTGVTEIYVLDLQTGQELQMAYQQGEYFPPDIAFSAESIIKIPVMISSFRRATKPVSANFTALVEKMIEVSDNAAPDTLMKTLIDPNIGPLGITEDMTALGLKNTFLGGMFYYGAPLIISPTTPANSRTDVNTSPDPYSQTTPAEMGNLLNDIYECAQNGGGAFAAVFSGKITQNDCKSMITYLARNHIGVLLEAGLPEGIQIGHKHGWVIEKNDGLMHTIGDAGLVYTPGGNYVMVVFMSDTNQIVFDNANHLFASLSRAVYNYFNLTSQ
jgi:beta-lactamase class A